MAIFDLTFNNPSIHAYFEGSDTYAPTSELIYVHTHLVQHSFLSQLESLINMANDRVERGLVGEVPAVKPKLVHRITNASEDIAKLLPAVDEVNAGKILVLLREIYQTCGRILKDET